MAKNSIDNLVEEIKKHVLEEVDKAKQEAVKNTGKRFVEEFPKIVSSAMDQFYLAYNPDYYVRTYGLHEGVTTGLYLSFSGNRIDFEISEENVPDHIHDSGEYIFEGGFMRGIHGRSSICVSTPPWMYIQEDGQDLMNSIALEEWNNSISKIQI